ncbi:universal stress protein [Pararhizobium sp. O133]|uniref:universal stress protein n=1 Tax=Pararhizobium sp. O133 TaxID=3449278 RepID=UPI003F6891BA
MKPQFHLPLTTYPDPSSFTLLQNAITFARNQSADLNVTIARVKIPNVHSAFPPVLDIAKMSADAEGTSRDNAEFLAQAVRDYADTAGISATISYVETLEPQIGETISRRARIYDCSIMEAVPTARSLVESILFDSGRPVVLYPSETSCGRVDVIAIAWDGSATLARALTGARPFLDQSRKIVLISVVDDKAIDEELFDRFAAALQKGGLSVDVAKRRADGERAATVLQGVAKEYRADLLIAGGYGHSRLRERLLGGVTQSFLAGSEIPMLLAH